MARPKTKQELIHLSGENFRKLNELIESYAKKDRITDFSSNTMNRNIRDVLAHLHEWHTMFLDWYTVGMSGEKPSMPAEGYSWKSTSLLNKEIWTKYRDTSLERIRKKLNSSFQAVQKVMEAHTDEELFEKKRYAWTGSTSLGSYLVSATSSHYDWAYKLIRRGKGK